mmetsp:Transcript_9265/g.17716  ORF Transcript_9265/g.17716 Transcript_9265/m.17716 type:complete len:179 (-) Transcript_9265:384-920(-)
MIPLIKVVSLVVRLFSRPVINYFKVSFKNTEIANPFLRRKIIAAGQFYHMCYTKTQRILMNSSSTAAYVKPLTEAAAVESGIEIVGEMLFYGTLMTWGTWELYKYTLEGKAKEEMQRDVMTNIQTTLGDLDFKFEVISSDLRSLQNLLEQIKRNATDPVPEAILGEKLDHPLKVKLVS